MEKRYKRFFKESENGIFNLLVDAYGIDKHVADTYMRKIIKAKNDYKIKSILSDILDGRDIEKAFKIIKDEI